MGECPVCGDRLSARCVSRSKQAVIRIICPLDIRHFELIIRDPIAVREYAQLDANVAAAKNAA